MKAHRAARYAAAFTAFIFASCATMADYDFSGINSALFSGNYDAAYEMLEADSSLLYSEHDDVLYALDKGMLSHYAGDYKRSNTELAEAERKIFDNFSKSITQSISSFLVNDTVIDYAGETFEDIYTNLFMALNYLNQDDTEGAFVEIRRFDNKLKTVSAQYADLIAEANKENQANGSATLPADTMEFHNSALARYLSLIMYRGAGKLDSAEIDRKYIRSAFQLQPNLYPFAVPSCIAEEFSVPDGMARLNVVAFSGKAPVKTEEVTRLGTADASFYYKLALPVMNKQFSAVSSITVSAVSADGTVAVSEQLEKIESIENIAVETFSQKQALLYLKAVARSIAKSAATSTWGVLSDSADDDNVSMFFSLMQVVSAVTTEATERADVRVSRYFPATASVAGLTVPPGDYTVSVSYKNKEGKIISQDEFSVAVKTSSINLVESVCLR